MQSINDMLAEVEKTVLQWIQEEVGNRVTSNNGSMLFQKVQQRINAIKLELLKTEEKKEKPDDTNK